jgi:hypothetical protein
MTNVGSGVSFVFGEARLDYVRMSYLAEKDASNFASRGT